MCFADDSWKIISDTADSMPDKLPEDPKMFSFAKKVSMEEYVRFKKRWVLGQDIMANDDRITPFILSAIGL